MLPGRLPATASAGGPWTRKRPLKRVEGVLDAFHVLDDIRVVTAITQVGNAVCRQVRFLRSLRHDDLGVAARFARRDDLRGRRRTGRSDPTRWLTADRRTAMDTACGATQCGSPAA